MTLDETLKNIKPSIYITIVVNNKFTLFNCIKGKMIGKDHMEYIRGFENIEVVRFVKTIKYSYNSIILYVQSQTLEERCLQLENMWYNQNNTFMNKREVLIW